VDLLSGLHGDERIAVHAGAAADAEAVGIPLMLMLEGSAPAALFAVAGRIAVADAHAVAAVLAVMVGPFRRLDTDGIAAIASLGFGILKAAVFTQAAVPAEFFGAGEVLAALLAEMERIREIGGLDAHAAFAAGVLGDLPAAFRAEAAVGTELSVPLGAGGLAAVGAEMLEVIRRLHAETALAAGPFAVAAAAVWAEPAVGTGLKIRAVKADAAVEAGLTGAGSAQAVGSLSAGRTPAVFIHMLPAVWAVVPFLGAAGNAYHAACVIASFSGALKTLAA